MTKGTHKTKSGKTAKKGLWYNIAQKKKKGKTMRKKGAKGAPTEAAIKRSQSQGEYMVSRSGGAPIRTNKVRSGPDQAFTLPKGTSAAPIKGPGMGVKPKTIKHKSGPNKGKINIVQTYKKQIAKLQKLIDKNTKKKKG